MPIEVHCPNPICAKVHQVKNRYAGMRGKCPACASWMYVPTVGAMPSMVAPRPEGLAEAARLQSQSQSQSQWPSEPETRSLAFDDPPEPTARPLAPEPRTPAPAPRRGAPKPTLLEPAEDEVPAEEATVKPKARRHFSKLAVVLTLLGILGMGAAAASPYLEKPSVSASGGFAESIGKQTNEGISEEYVPYVLGAAGAVAGAALLSLLTALLARRYDLLSVFLLYTSTVLAGVLFFIALSAYRAETVNVSKIQASVATRKAAGTQGDVTAFMGQQYYAAIGGTAVAGLAFLLATLAAHRGWLARVPAFLLLGGFLALGGVWIYRSELGVDGYFPAAIEAFLEPAKQEAQPPPAPGPLKNPMEGMKMPAPKGPPKGK